jgi:hemerythrin-like metal-binding protein
MDQNPLTDVRLASYSTARAPQGPPCEQGHAESGERFAMDGALTIQFLAECGATHAALDSEHKAIEGALGALKNAILSAASDTVFLRILDTCIDFCEAHFRHEEAFLRAHGIGVDSHHAAHERLLHKFRQARVLAIEEDIACGALDAYELLHDFEDHVRNFDGPAHDQLEHGLKAAHDAALISR